MSFMTRLFGADSQETRAMTHSDLWGMNVAEAGLATAAGQNVTADTAMQVSTVFSCVRIISDNVSTLPLDIFNSENGTRKPFGKTPQWAKFQDGPLSKIDLMSQVTVSIMLAGNAFLATYRDATMRIIGLEVLDPETVTVRRVRGQTLYQINGGELLTRRDVLHIPGMMMPGALVGMNPIQYARESIGLSLSATQYGAAFFGNGALPGMTVEVPGELSDVGIKQLKRGWNDTHQGAGNSHKLAVLTEGAKFNQVTVNAKDAQFLETRQFQVTDITRIFGVPPHLVGDSSNSTSWGSGLAEQNTTFVQHTLRPMVERLETALNFLVRSEGLPDSVFVKLTLDGLLRGDTSERLASYAVGLASGFYTIDEVRAWEDLPPLPEASPAPPAPVPDALVDPALTGGPNDNPDA
jgi:HK97 family phage portal protein